MTNIAISDRPEPAEHLFPIRTVASLTGVNPVTLRAWERRYGLVKPRRTPKGHRLYSQADIELIHRIVSLLDRGISVSRVSGVLDDDGAEGDGDAGEEPSPWDGFQQRLLDAAGRFDEAALDSAYEEALSLYPVDLVTERVVIPMLRTLGGRWRQGHGGVAEEHFFGVYLRNKLGARFHHLGRDSDGPKLAAACLPGEQHETGLLLFCLSAAARGYRMAILGADLPISELEPATKRSKFDAWVLSGSLKPPRNVLETALARAVRNLSIPVSIGGDVSVHHRDAIVRAGAHPLGNQFGPALRRIDELLGRTGG